LYIKQNKSYAIVSSFMTLVSIYFNTTIIIVKQSSKALFQNSK